MVIRCNKTEIRQCEPCIKCNIIKFLTPLCTYKQTHKQALVHRKKKKCVKMTGLTEVAICQTITQLEIKLKKTQTHNLLNVLSNLFFSKENRSIHVCSLFGPKLHNCNHATECSVFKNKPGQQMYFSVC